MNTINIISVFTRADTSPQSNNTAKHVLETICLLRKIAPRKEVVIRKTYTAHCTKNMFADKEHLNVLCAVGRY